MSSSSDIEKLFDHFGGDATAYQEIGRENEARSARTRWPLLETLDLTQPAIPAIGQRREPKPQARASAAQPDAGAQDTTPKDAASVTRAKAPLFTRSPRRDIPPVVVATRPAAPSGAPRFGVLEAASETRAPSAPETTRVDAVASAAAAAVTAVSPAVTLATAPAQAAPMPYAGLRAAVPPASATPAAMTMAGAPPAIAWRPQATPVIPPALPGWAQAPARARAYGTAPAVPVTPAAPAQPASILGKLFAPQPHAVPPQPAAASGEGAPLQSVFDRLRGTPACTATAPAAAPNSWLVNGPRRS